MVYVFRDILQNQGQANGSENIIRPPSISNGSGPYDMSSIKPR